MHAVDGREFITTQRLVKSKPKDEGSGSHIFSSVKDTNLGTDGLVEQDRNLRIQELPLLVV